MLALILTKDQSFKNILIISQSPKKGFWAQTKLQKKF